MGANLISAIESNINSLKAKNSTDDFVHDSKYFLIKFSHHLYGVKVSGTSYRQAVERLLLDVKKKERTFCINLAREFYCFWKSANRSLAEIDYEKTLKLDAQNEEFNKL